MARSKSWIRRAPRLLAEQVVPALLGLAAGMMTLTLVPLNGFGLGACLAIGLLVGFSAAWALQLVRHHPRWRLWYRLAVLGHVLFWSYLGITGSSLRPPGVPQIRPGTHDGSILADLRAGLGEAGFVVPHRCTIGGWGMRPRRFRVPAFAGLGVLGRFSQDLMARGAANGEPRYPLFKSYMAADPHDRLRNVGARALSVSCGEGAPMTWVRMDLVTVSPGMVDTILERVSTQVPGVDRSRLVVSATHTHSSMASYSEQRLAALAGTDHFRPDVQRAAVDAAVRAVSIAHATRARARIAPFSGRDRGPQGGSLLARNRRTKNDVDIDDRIVGLRIDDAKGTTLGVLLNYAVHPTVMKKDTDELHRDVVGAVEEALSHELRDHPMIVFLNGAQGDIGPARIAGFRGEARAKALAIRFAKHVAPIIQSVEAYSQGRLHTAYATCDLGSPFVVVARDDRNSWADRFRHHYAGGSVGRTICDVLAYPANAMLWSVGLTEGRLAFDFRGRGATLISLEPSMEQSAICVGAWVLELGGGDTPTAAVAGLWQPGEATRALGSMWRKMAKMRGYEHCILVGLAGGACAYLTTPDEYETGSYEALATIYGPGGGQEIGAGLEGALDACDPKGE